MRRAFISATLLACAIPAFCAASAAGRPHWSRVDFTEATHLGAVRVFISTRGDLQDRHVERVRIWSNGRELRVPGGDAFRVTNPELHEVQLTYASSYTCIEDDCPDIRAWPVTLIVPFGETIEWGEGERPVSNSCDQSFLAIDILADRVVEVSINECTRAGSKWIEIFEAK